MNFPSSVIQKLERWSGFDSGTTRCSTGTTTRSTAVTAKIAVHTGNGKRRVMQRSSQDPAAMSREGGCRFLLRASRLSAPSLQCKQSLRPLLDEKDDEDQHHDLREYRAGPWLEELGDRPEAEGGDHCPGELANAAQHDDHEAVDDVALAEIGTDVADL